MITDTIKTNCNARENIIGRWIDSIHPPFFLYDLNQFAQALECIGATPAKYYYPVKANPHPKLVKMALQMGFGVDVCSPNELDLVFRLGARPEQISYCSVCMTQSLIVALARNRIRVSLNAFTDLKTWLTHSNGAHVGIRLALPQISNSYGSKFGFTLDELRDATNLMAQNGLSLKGLHIHASHDIASASNQKYAALFDALECSTVDVEKLEYISLGGGWSFPYGEDVPPREITSIAHRYLSEVRGVLGKSNFRGEMCIEPGEFILAQCGYWGAEVTAVKNTAKRSIVIVNSQSILSAAPDEGRYQYPVEIYRQKNGVHHHLGRRNQIVADIMGATNSPLDLIRTNVEMPYPKVGDLIVFRQTGAYVSGLMSCFNSIDPPKSYVWDGQIVHEA